MRPRLLFAGQDRGYPKPPPEVGDLECDLGIPPVLDAMASGDAYLRDVAERVLLSPPLTPEEIDYRLNVLDDCLHHPDAIRELYELAATATGAKRRVHAWLSTDRCGAILRSSAAILRDLAVHLERLHDFALEHHGQFRSSGLTALLASIERDLGDDYLAQVRSYLEQLKFSGGVVLTARLGPGCTGIDYSLRDAAPTPWFTRLSDSLPHHRSYTYHLPPRDEYGGRTLERIRDHGINEVANAAAQSADHVLDFFRRLAFEVGFYLACVHLHEDLARTGVTTCRPTPETEESRALTARALVDVGLAVRSQRAPVGSDLDADGKALIMVTGANQGGKSTFLRAIGLAQLMFDAGLFVTADRFRASPSAGVFTHYRREEDTTLRHGKFDDELVRMSQLVDRLTPNAIALLDESFSSTNEIEGSQVARDIVDSLVTAGVRVCYVTHLYPLAHGLAQQHDPRHLFFRAQRDPGGLRSYRIIPAEPEATSYAVDQFREVFAEPLRIKADRSGGQAEPQQSR
ncbi:MAG: hypothetical protein L0H96_10170 [Humibacillus sp.]|nr:hypothetical protein [Humibacillus sp.]MDN5777266.1 hypothetical protein [Humibacillus sp.]